MINYILSNGLKAYQKERGIDLSDSQIATLIYQSGYSMNEIYAALQELAWKTENNELKGQIYERFEEERERWAAFTAESDGMIFLLEVYEESDKEYQEEGYYKCFEAAQDAAYMFHVEYRITKVRIFQDGKAVQEQIRQTGHILSELGTGYFSCNHQLNSFWSTEYKAKISFETENKRFENQYVEIRHPFRKGDIVQNLLTGEVGVVNCIADDEEMETDLSKKMQDEDFSAGVLFVELLDDQGCFYHTHLMPTQIDFWDVEKLKGVRKYLLMHVSDLLKGKGSLCNPAN